MTPTSLELDRVSHLTVQWADGVTAKWDIEDLRLACPCAECRTKREGGQRPVPESGQPIMAIDAKFVGSYALGIDWADGRCSSIYAFDTLRRWADNAASGTPSFHASTEDRRAAGHRDDPSAPSSASPAASAAEAPPSMPEGGSFS